MKAFLARVFAMHPLALMVALLIVPPASVLLCLQVRNVGMTERVITEQGAQTRAAVIGWLDANVAPEFRQLSASAAGLPQVVSDLADHHATRIEDVAQTEIRNGVDQVKAIADGYGAMANARLEQGLGEVHHIHEAAGPAIAGAVRLEDTYAALPGQLGAKLGPSWAAIEPEITSRRADGSGYGGSWHARFTALLGEAALVGGVFTQHFPSLADSVTGVAADVHLAADKYLVPHPAIGFWAKVKLGLKIVKDLVTAWLRGGGIGL